MKEQFTVAGIGELLWDIFPTHKRLGGAPTNFVCHCNQLGAKAYPISCIGADELGLEIREQLTRINVDGNYIFESQEHPTGTVQVFLDKTGKPCYTIQENVAWDHIQTGEILSKTAKDLDAVCFGSLSQRSNESRHTIQAFLNNTPQKALKIFDVNLRQSYYSKEIINESLKLANILKLSDEELPTLAEYFNLTGNVLEQLDTLRQQFDLKVIAYTRGPDGSILLGTDEMDDFHGCEGLAVDSVGAGDSFTASLCMGLLHGWSLKRINKFANQVATYVCSQKGATPILPEYLTTYQD